MTGEGNGAGSAFVVPDFLPLVGGWVAGPATCLDPARGVRVPLMRDVGTQPLNHLRECARPSGWRLHRRARGPSRWRASWHRSMFIAPGTGFPRSA